MPHRSQARNFPFTKSQQIHWTLDQTHAVEITLPVIPTKQRFEPRQTQVFGTGLPWTNTPANHPDGTVVAQFRHDHPTGEGLPSV